MLIATTAICQAQIINHAKVATVKSSKLIIGLTGKEEFDSDLKAAVEENWKFSTVAEYLPMEEAKKKAKKDDNFLVLEFRHVNSSSCSHKTPGQSIKYRIVTSGYQLAITQGGSMKNFVATFIPTFNNTTTREILFFAVSLMNNTLETMEKDNMKNNFKINSVFNERASALNNKTLFVAEGWLSDKLPEDELKKIYPAKIKVASYEEWRDAILTKKEGTAYMIVVPMPAGDSYIYYHYIMDAETSQCIGIVKPKAPVNIGGVNVSNANTGYLNKKVATKYAELLQKK